MGLTAGPERPQLAPADHSENSAAYPGREHGSVKGMSSRHSGSSAAIRSNYGTTQKRYDLMTQPREQRGCKRKSPARPEGRAELEWVASSHGAFRPADTSSAKWRILGQRYPPPKAQSLMAREPSCTR